MELFQGARGLAALCCLLRSQCLGVHMRETDMLCVTYAARSLTCTRLSVGVYEHLYMNIYIYVRKCICITYLRMICLEIGTPVTRARCFGSRPAPRCQVHHSVVVAGGIAEWADLGVHGIHLRLADENGERMEPGTAAGAV